MKKNYFTLVELTVSMAVLAIFMFGMMRLFTSIQKMMNNTDIKNELFYSARTVMDIISNDIDCWYIEKDGSGNTLSDRTYMAAKKYADCSYFRLAARRPDKNVGATTNIAIISYDYDPKNMSLKMATYWDNTPFLTIFPVGKTMTELTGSPLTEENHNFKSTGGGFPLVTNSNYQDYGTEIMNGVIAFEVNFAYVPNTTGSVLPTEAYTNDEICKGKIPDQVIISFSLIDSETIRKVEAALGLDVAGSSVSVDYSKILDGSSTVTGQEKAKALMEAGRRDFSIMIPIRK